MPGNRLELDIVARNLAEPETKKAAKSFESLEQQVARSAQSMNKSADSFGVALARSIQKGTAGAEASLQSLERRAALVGRTGVDKLLAQRTQVISRYGDDEAAIARVVAAYDRLISAQQRVDRSRAQLQTRKAGVAAGQAVLPGAAAFDAGLKRVQTRDLGIGKLEEEARSRSASQLGPFAAIEARRQVALTQYGANEQAIKRVNVAFDQMAESERKAIDTGRWDSRRESIASFAIQVAAAGGIVKAFLLDTATYAARNETLAVVTDRLALSNGLGIPAVERQVAAVRRRGITEQDSRNAVNQLIVAQLDVAKTPDLARAAQDAGVVAGVNSSDALTGIVHGIVTQQTDVLRTYGIQVDFQRAFARATKELGHELSEAEKKNVALKTVLESAGHAAGAYESAMSTAGKQVTSLKRFVDEARGAIGQGLVPALSETVTVLTRAFIHVQQHAGLYSVLAKAVGTAVTAFAAFRIASFAAGLFGLGSIGGPVGIAVAAIVALGGALLFSTSKVDAQRDAINLHIDQLNAQKEALGFAGLSQAEYRKEIESTNRALLAADVHLAKLAADERRLGSSFNTGEGYTIETPARTYSANGKTLTEGQYESRYEHRNKDVTYNQKLADQQKNEQQALLAQQTAQQDRVRLAQELLQARQSGLKLDSQYAEIQEATRSKEISARLDASKELTSPADIVNLLDLARDRVQREQNQILNEHRYRVDEKTGATRDLSGTSKFQQLAAAENANLPLRLRNEYAKVLGDIEAHDSKYFESQRDREEKSRQDLRERRSKGAQQLAEDEARQNAAVRDRDFELAASASDRARDLAMETLSSVNAQTLREKIALEDKKLAIETAYARNAVSIQIGRLEFERDVAIGEAKKKAADSGYVPGEAQYDRAGAEIDRNYQQQIDAARNIASDKELAGARKTANEKGKLQLEENRRVFDNLKQSASGLFDALISHTQSFGDALKATIKSAILTPIKEILASQTAALLTQLLTGQKVTFGGVGTGQGALGRVGDLFGKLGLGPAKFDLPNLKTSTDINTGATDRNTAALERNTQSKQLIQGGGGYSPFGVGALASLGAKVGPMLAVARLFGSSGGKRIESIGEKISFPDVGPGVTDLGGTITGGNSGGGSFGPESLGIPGGLNLPGLGGSSGAGGRGGILGKILGLGSPGPSGPAIAGQSTSALSNLAGFFGFGSGAGGTYGSGTFGTGISGGLKALGKSNAALLGGGLLAFDGLRQGGVKGLAETTAGGALIGFKYGGPIGAAIGAGVGAIAGTVRLFVKGGREKIKDEVHKVYGIKISDGIADQIQQIAKQSYGGDWRVAIRSQQVRELIRLYSQTIGSDAQKQFVGDTVHAASLSQSGGRLTQNAIFDNGSAFSYQSPLAINGGIETSLLSTSARGSGAPINLHLDRAATVDLIRQGSLEGINGNPRAVASAAVAGYGSSSGRAGNAAMALAPSVVQQ